MAYRLATILLVARGHKELAQGVRWAWLAFAVYTWVGPTWFNRALRKELEPVRLRGDY